MKSKVIDVRSDMAVAARDLENNAFKAIPRLLIPQFGNLIPPSQQPLLMSATIGVSGSHFFVITHREDLADYPDTVNTEVALFGYGLGVHGEHRGSPFRVRPRCAHCRTEGSLGVPWGTWLASLTPVTQLF